MNQSQAAAAGNQDDQRGKAADLGDSRPAADPEAGREAATLWLDGVPVSPRFDDPYYSLAGGLSETRHVFLAGNDLPGRFRHGLHIAELGFGTGLNLLVTVLAWQRQGLAGTFRFTSFEAYPLPAEDLARALAAFPEVSDLAPALLAAWTELDVAGTAAGDGPRAGASPDSATEASAAAVDDSGPATPIIQFRLGPAEVELVLGDARHALPAWQGRADVWYLDGFSPARNPELWGEVLMAEVARHSAPGASFATYTAAGHVRRALEAVGFDVQRAPGYGRKRHMSRGTLKDPL